MILCSDCAQLFRVGGFHWPPKSFQPFAVVIRVSDATDNAIETHEQAGDFKEW
jgi:hypothetical protein